MMLLPSMRPTIRSVLGATLAGLCIVAASPLAVGAAVVAVFDNPDFVDTYEAPPFGASDNVQASLAMLGHTVVPFSGVTGVGFSAALAGADVLVIPPLQNGDLAAVLDSGAIAVIGGFVDNGGGLIVLGSWAEPLFLLNTVFGFSLSGTYPEDYSSRTALVEGTPFASGPEGLGRSYPGLSLQADALPPRTKVVYEGGGSALVARMPFGSGRIVYLGGVWYDEAPRGEQDRGWNDVLAAALLDVLACGSGGATDTDGDSIADGCDDCPGLANFLQDDTDLDDVGDGCDNCPVHFNVAQADADGDTIGDACDTDRDGDGIANDDDNCPQEANAGQADSDSDALGDACDTCPATFNPGRTGERDAASWKAAFDAWNASIAAAVPDRFDFEGGDIGTSIADGGSDMYDGGNILWTGAVQGAPYWEDDPSVRAYTAGAVAHHTAATYFTAKYPGLFVAMFDELWVDEFWIDGETGADGVGTVETATFPIVAGGRAYTIFLKRTFGAGDPSIQQLLIVPGGAGDVVQTVPASSASDGHRLSGLASKPFLLYLLVSRAGGRKLEDADVIAVASAALTSNSQTDTDGDGLGDACDPDGDGDGIPDGMDPCPHDADVASVDGDGDGDGDACDTDDDGDGWRDSADLCPFVADPAQHDGDYDHVGDACDPCPGDERNDVDGDGLCEAADNCTDSSNADQADADADSLGDACDPCSATDAASLFVDARLTLKSWFPSWGERSCHAANLLTLRGTMSLPGAGVAAFNPRTSPVRFLLHTGDRVEALDVTLPTDAYEGAGTAGWLLAADGGWAYRDSRDVAQDGVRSVKIRPGRDASGSVAIQVKAVGSCLEGIRPGAQPFQFALVPDSSVPDVCVQTAHVTGSCFFASASPFVKLKCRRTP